MQSTLRYELQEYAGSQSEGMYLRKPLPAGQLKNMFPNLRGMVFEFDLSAFRPLQYDHQAYFAEILEAFDLEEISIRNYGRLSFLPDSLWKPSLRKLELPYSHSKNKMEVKLPAGYHNQLRKVSIHNASYIDDKIFDSPYLTDVAISHYEGSLAGLSKAVNLEYLNLSAIQTPKPDFTFHSFNKLNSLNLYRIDFLETLPDMGALQQLQQIKLSNLPLLKDFPESLKMLSQLRHIEFYQLGSPDNAPIPFSVFYYPFLETLFITDCHFKYPSIEEEIATSQNDKKEGFFSKIFNKKIELNTPQLPAFRIFHLHDKTLTEIPGYFIHPGIEDFQISLPKLKQLPDTFWACTSLKRVNITVEEMRHTGQGWQWFTALENVHIETSSPPEQWPDLGRCNVALASITLKANEIKNLPASWAECPELTNMHITGQIDELPQEWAYFPKLVSLRITNRTHPIFIRKEMALKPGLSLYFEYKAEGRDLKLIQQLNNILEKANAPESTRLVFGKLLLEKKEKEYFNTPELKTQLLQAININQSQLKQIVFDHIHLLNPQQEPFSAARDLTGKQLYISGKTRLKKADYKDKLQALGINMVSKLSNDVDIILVGDACPDIPSGFWDTPRWFCSEADFDKIQKEKQPGFLQTLETNELDALWQLIWSNDPGNERVVLEMMRKGGVPDEVIPDLVVVAKTSKDTAVRNDFRNLLKAKAPEELRSILSNTRDMDKILQRLKYGINRPQGIAQMTLCHYRRTGNPDLLHDFFIYKESLGNPFRNKLFQEFCPYVRQRPHYVSLYYQLFTTEELQQLLSESVFQGKLKRLLIRCSGDVLPEAIFNHTTLHELTIATEAGEVPDEISRLKRLQILDITGRNLHKLPAGLAQIGTLKRVSLGSSANPEQWQIPDELRQWLSEKNWMPRRFDFPD